MGCVFPSMSSTSWPAGVSDCNRNIHKCGMKFWVTPLSGLYSRIFTDFSAAFLRQDELRRGSTRTSRWQPRRGVGSLVYHCGISERFIDLHSPQQKVGFITNFMQLMVQKF